MIFDFTDLGTGVNVRFKPRNHITVEGNLYHGEELIASLRTLVLVYSNQEYDLAGGRFELAWHKMRGPITQPLTLVATIEDDRFANPRAVFVTDPDAARVAQGCWIIDDVQILYEGSPIAIGNFNELLGREVVFFGRRAARQQLSESA